ncbi:MAG: hypothetical protein IH962_03620 [Chloroflexi bacterium]|nr:hypothetical protein [Chloroflexota bacterium]
MKRRLVYLPKVLPLRAISGLLMVLAAACSAAATPSPTVPPASLLGGPDFSAIIITTDMALGPNRVVFGLIDRDGMPVRTNEAQVSAFYLTPGQDAGELRASGAAKFMHWPVGGQGVFSTSLDLDRAGFWQLQATTTTDDGTPVVALGAFQVKDKAETPAIGDPAPRSVTLTAGDVDDLSKISSSGQPDPDLYRLSVHQALDEGKPLVVVFATPAFCVSATCGPQVEIISQLKDQYSDRANFIHVEVFKDPHLIQGRRPSPEGVVAAVDEWNLPTEPWTFVVDKEGRIHAKFEQFTTVEELEAALLEVL